MAAANALRRPVSLQFRWLVPPGRRPGTGLGGGARGRTTWGRRTGCTSPGSGYRRSRAEVSGSKWHSRAGARRSSANHPPARSRSLASGRQGSRGVASWGCVHQLGSSAVTPQRGAWSTWVPLEVPRLPRGLEQGRKSRIGRLVADLRGSEVFGAAGQPAIMRVCVCAPCVRTEVLP